MRRGDWPVVGRDEQLREFELFLRAKDARPVIIAGAAGVGKTRLGWECLELCRRASFATATVIATQAASGLPFGALAPLLPAVDPEVTGPLGKAGLLHHLARTIVDRAEGRPLALFVDDAHLLDDASATVIHQLAVSNAALVLATVRTGAPTPDAVRALCNWPAGLARATRMFKARCQPAFLPAVLLSSHDAFVEHGETKISWPIQAGQGRRNGDPYLWWRAPEFPFGCGRRLP